MLNPRITKDAKGVLWLEWDPDNTADGYMLYRDGAQVSRTFDPARKKAKLGVDPGVPVSAGVAAADVTVRAVENTRYPDEEPEPPTGMGAKLNAAFPPLAGLQLVDMGGETLNSVYLLDGANQGMRHIRNVKSQGASDAFKFAGGAHDIVLERFEVLSASSQGVNMQRAPKRIRYVSGVIRNVGGDKFDHCGYVGAGSEDILFAAVLMHSASGEVMQWYPGPCDGVMTHCTIGKGSSSQEEIVVWGGGDDTGTGTGRADVTLWNCIIDGDIQIGGSDTLLKLRGTCCVTGAIPASVDTTGCNLIRESPGFDANYRPTNPKLLGSGDPGWTPPADCRGVPYTRATVGAVAA